MFKKLMFTTLIICLLSIFIYQNVSYAGTAITTWINADKKVTNMYKLVTNEVNQYHDIRSGIETLISDWNRNQDAIKNSNMVMLIATGGVIVSGVVAIATKGSLFPAAYVAVATAIKKHTDTTETTARSEEYLTAMSTLLSLMDTARANVDAAYNGGYLSVAPGSAWVGSAVKYEYTKGYDATYDDYMTMGAGHVDGYSVSALDSSVKMGKESGYYHQVMHTGDQRSNEDHVFENYWPLSHWTVKPDLPKNHPCEGPCSDMFRTPYEALTSHQVTCGDGTVQDVDDEFSEIIDGYEKYGPPLDPHNTIYSIQDILNKRSVTQGCGRSYYKCPSRLDHKDIPKHEVRTCAKTYTSSDGTEGACLDSEGNPLKYRRCMGHARDHNESDWIGLESTHSDEGDSNSDDSDGEDTSDVVDNSPDCDSCTDSCSACADITYPCGVHSGHPGNASGHAPIGGSCSGTNGWGHSCNATHYMCEQSPTHTFPTFSCGRGGCTESVSDPQEHRRTCQHGIKYWSCKKIPEDMVERHKLRTCTRRKVLRRVWDPQIGAYRGVEGVCGETYSNCHGGSKCRDIYGRVGTHTDVVETPVVPE